MSARTVLPPVSTKAAGIHDALPHPRDPAHSARESSSASQNPQSQLQGATEMKDLCVGGGVFLFFFWFFLCICFFDLSSDCYSVCVCGF